MDASPRLLKLLILGDFRVGKTHLIRTITKQSQVFDYEPTFGVVFSKTDFLTASETWRLLLVRYNVVGSRRLSGVYRYSEGVC